MLVHAARATLLPLFLLAGLALPAPSSGADPEAGKSAAPAPAASPAITLQLGGRKIFTFRATMLGYDPQARSDGARTRLLSAYQKNPRLTLTARHVAEGSQVLADGAVMFIITPGDVNPLAGETTESEAARVIATLQRIIEERAQRGDPIALGQGVGFAVVATLVAYLLLKLIFALDARVGRWAARRVAERVQQVKVSGVSMLDEGIFLRLARRLVHLLAWFAGGVVAFLWLNAVLESLPFTRPWGEQLTAGLLGTITTIGMAILDSIPGLLFVIVIFVLARLLTQATKAFFERVVERDLRLGWLDRDTAPPTRMIFNAGVWIFALAMAYQYLPGAESRAFQGLSVFVGLIVTIGASSTVGQAAGGLILMYTRAYRVGEYVRIQDIEGTITELGLFATRLRTGLGEEVMLPNSMVLSTTSKNYSRAFPGTGFVLDTVVTIGYDTPWRQVEAMLVEAARRTPGILADPAPRVFQTALSDFYPEYRLVAYSTAQSPMPRAQALDRLHGHIQDVFNEHGVQIMSPHYLGDPEQAKIVPKARWFEAPAKPDSA